MDWPLVYELYCQVECSVAMSGMDNLWKHLRGKPASRLGIVIEPWEMITLIGFKCKRSNALSWEVLMFRFLLRNLQTTKSVFINFVEEFFMGVPFFWTGVSCITRWSTLVPDETFMVKSKRHHPLHLCWAAEIYFRCSALQQSLWILKSSFQCWWFVARATPLPIPNREVKPCWADDTLSWGK